MSTDSLHIKIGKTKYLNRFAELAKLDEVVFHSDDLANLWHITTPNTLYTTLKRYVQKGLLFRIHKGFYALKPITEIDPQLLGIKLLHSTAYVSTETVLAEEGIIQQDIPVITLMSNKRRRFSIGTNKYYSRKLPDQFLYNSLGIITHKNGLRKATLERAISDLLYYNPQYYFDAGTRIKWKSIRDLQKQLGYPVIKKSYA